MEAVFATGEGRVLDASYFAVPSVLTTQMVKAAVGALQRERQESVTVEEKVQRQAQELVRRLALRREREQGQVL